MQNAKDCLNEAMFVASQSYSGSTYETTYASCDETLPFAPENDTATIDILAA